MSTATVNRMVREDEEKRHKCCKCHAGYESPESLMEHFRMCGSEKAHVYHISRSYMPEDIQKIKRLLTLYHDVEIVIHHDRKPRNKKENNDSAAAALKEKSKWENSQESAFQTNESAALPNSEESYTPSDDVTEKETIGSNSNVASKSVPKITKKTFQCGICNEILHNKYDYIRHKQSKHRKKNVYTCYKCYKVYNHKRHLIRHWKKDCNTDGDEDSEAQHDAAQENVQSTRETPEIETDNTVKVQSFVARGEKIPKELILSKVSAILNESQEYPCAKCKDVFKIRGDLEKHMQSHPETRDTETESEAQNGDQSDVNHGEGKGIKDNQNIGVGNGNTQASVKMQHFDCKQCNSVFLSKKNFSRHRHKVHGYKKYTCRLCGEKLKSKRKAGVHMRTHFEDNKMKMENSALELPPKAEELETVEDGVKLEDTIFQCNVCNLQYVDKIEFDRHLRRVHKQSGIYRCIVCRQSFDDRRHLQNHMANHTNEGGANAKENGGLADSPNNAQIIRERHDHSDVAQPNVRDPNRPFQCNTCHRSFRFKANLAVHVKVHGKGKDFEQITQEHTDQTSKQDQIVHDPNRPFQCKSCDKSFRLKANLAVHMKVHGEGKDFECEVCSLHFRSKGSYVLHLRTHNVKKTHSGNKLKPFKCSQCDKAFSKKCYLGIHNRTHRKEKSFRCAKCDKTFTTFSMLSVHARKHKGQKQSSTEHTGSHSEKSERLIPFAHPMAHDKDGHHRCKICLKTFTFKGGLEHHMRIHSDKSYRCGICKRSFSSKEDLKNHSRAHTGEKPHKCGFCGKSFFTKTVLEKHLHKHNDEKLMQPQKLIKPQTFKCKYCGISFDQKHDLIEHAQLHKSKTPRPCICTICDRSFTTQKRLDNHMQKHNTEVHVESFECEKCAKTFSDGKDLKMHMKTHGRSKPHKCNQCQKGFKTEAELKAHKLTYIGAT